MKRTLLAIVAVCLCLSPLEAAGKWRVWLGAVLIAAGTYAVVDGLTPEKKQEYGDITNASYKIASSDFNETSSSPYVVSSTSGIIVNNGNVAMTGVTIKGLYYDAELNRVYEQSVAASDINTGGTFLFSMPDYNSGDIFVKSVGFTASFSHETIYGYKDVENIRNGGAILPGILSVIAGSYLVYSYMVDKDVKTEDYLERHGMKLSFSVNPGNARIVLAKRI